MINLHTKFEVSVFTHYEGIKGNAKCRNWGGLVELGSPKVTGNVTIQYSAYDFLFDFNRNYAPVLYHSQVISSYLSKLAYFNLYHLHLVPPLGVTPFEVRQDLWRLKTSLPALSCGVISMILRLAVLTQYRRVID